MSRHREVSIPSLVLSRWFKWEDRSQYELKALPGVYVLAITSRELCGTRPRWKDVSYIGMTTSRGGLASRWQQFSNSIRGKEGHSGGKTVFRHLGPFGKSRKKLFVAAMGIQCNVSTERPKDYIRKGWIAFLEHEAFAHYARVVGGHPRYNTR